MTSARKLRHELGEYIAPYGMSVELAVNVPGKGGSGTGGRSESVVVFDDKIGKPVGHYTLNNPNAVVSAVKALHKLRPEVPELPSHRPPRATRSRKPVEQPGPLFTEPTTEPDDLDVADIDEVEGHDEGSAAFVEQLAEGAEVTPREPPPWDVVAAAARAAAVATPPSPPPAPSPARRAEAPVWVDSPDDTGPRRVLGCEVVMRVRSLGRLDDAMPWPLIDAAADGLQRGLPTWLVRDEAGHLAVLVTNTEPTTEAAA